MGGTPRGPSFTVDAPVTPPGTAVGPWPTSATTAGSAPRTAALPPQYGPPRSWLPGAVSVLVIALVVAVAAVATVLAERRAGVAAAPTPAPVAVPRLPPAQAGSIEFGDATGTGRLTVLDHSWSPARSSAGSAVLTVEVELVCLDGEVAYDPYFFQAFDYHGDLYGLADDDLALPQLTMGTLTGGQSVRGVIGFIIPRGEVTLLMSSDSSAAVVAIKLPS